LRYYYYHHHYYYYYHYYLDVTELPNPNLSDKAANRKESVT